MLSIEFAMLKIDPLVSNPALFSTVIFMWVLLFGIDFVLDIITRGKFLSSHLIYAFNAMGNLVGSPPITINETTLT